MKIKKKRERIESVEYRLMFDYEDRSGSGFSFDCDANGSVAPRKNDDAERNYQACLNGEFTFSDGTIHKVVEGEIAKFRHVYNCPAIGECNSCKRDVYLSGFTNTCECGLDYNMSGQQLAPRSQWGEETGESVSDILAADSDYDNEWDYGCP